MADIYADPFDSANREIGDNKRRLLEAVAQAGEAGRKSFMDAQSSIKSDQAEALARAQENARLMNLAPGALGTTAETTRSRYDQNLTDLTASQHGFNQALEGGKAASLAYMDKLMATMPVLQGENKKIIDQREKEIQAALAQAQAEREERERLMRLEHDLAMQRDAANDARAAARASASGGGDGPSTDDIMTKIMGGTAMAMEQAQGQIGGIEGALNHEKSVAQREAARVQQIDAWMKGKDINRLRSIATTNKHPGAPAKDRAMAEQWKRLTAERAQLVNRQGGRTQKIGQLQSQYDALRQTISNPTAVSRQLGVESGVDPLMVYGKLTEAKWQPIINAMLNNDKRGISEQATALQKKVNIKGGAKMVEEILNKPAVKKYIQNAQQHSQGYTWQQAVAELDKDWMKTGQDRTYYVLRELLQGLNWKPEKK